MSLFMVAGRCQSDRPSFRPYSLRLKVAPSTQPMRGKQHDALPPSRSRHQRYSMLIQGQDNALVHARPLLALWTRASSKLLGSQAVFQFSALGQPSLRLG